MSDDGFRVEPGVVDERSLSHVSIERTASGKVTRKVTLYPDDPIEVVKALRSRTMEAFIALEADIARY